MPHVLKPQAVLHWTFADMQSNEWHNQPLLRLITDDNLAEDGGHLSAQNYILSNNIHKKLWFLFLKGI